MLKSMTGFGKTVNENEGKKISVEIKSLNSKQADVYIKLPFVYREKETEIRNEIIKQLERGKIELSVSQELKQTEKLVSINKEVFSSYYNQLKSLQEELFPDQTTDWISVIMQLPNIVSQNTGELDENEWKILKQTINNAIAQLNDFRKTEGKVLEDDILQRITNIESLQLQIDAFEPLRRETVRSRLKQNLTGLFDKDGFDKNRFEQELIYYLEKMDFTEEKVRLINHCKYFKETCNEKNPGRKLSFITQEIGREINTLGSKANHSEIQKIVVQMKDELEKVKEQLLNIL
ncbi:MAG: YicC family protein [Bacteroidetes bacterium CG23_combo_of_CG06-09_8_20_14_all_32_9]|nr:MAG: YicC family protein [Bacteroidetes bacterium CG23_combo_of_CG06-09_8_20_14_all_32_9]